ncbi:MAG: hypothetical protein A2Z12_07310 [Actinobacteria bacterium RBG_16_68_21]|nr:MAG: hypothetical protein A2Z12_07310 [Actinobacteria bacterium RBG_16_68_21]
MTEPFVRTGDGVRVHLSKAEIAVLRGLPEVIAADGDAGGRLDYRAHPDDPTAEARYRDLIGEDLNRLRAADRRAFTRGLGRGEVTVEDAEAWMRVVGEARIVLAARLGITDDGWEDDARTTRDPEMALLAYLGYLQDALVTALS